MHCERRQPGRRGGGAAALARQRAPRHGGGRGSRAGFEVGGEEWARARQGREAHVWVSATSGVVIGAEGGGAQRGSGAHAAPGEGAPARPVPARHRLGEAGHEDDRGRPLEARGALRARRGREGEERQAVHVCGRRGGGAGCRSEVGGASRDTHAAKRSAEGGGGDRVAGGVRVSLLEGAEGEESVALGRAVLRVRSLAQGLGRDQGESRTRYALGDGRRCFAAREGPRDTARRRGRLC
mmetsp:Transcript_17682/g.55122  ORF Transcript_17682/g.55122 Transcript_17682/m.55122 type:complete len:239 (-) Transcript_17682:2579-3295(-)